METKIQFSAEEWSLVQNAEILLTKNRILEKVAGFLGELAGSYTGIALAESVLLPTTVSWKGPKISRGENYHGLPYLVLDYPRLFSKEDVFAIRTIFWWGNYFSITLHLKGIFCQFYRDAIVSSWEMLSANDFLVNITSEEWNHAINEENYRPVSEVGVAQIMLQCETDSLLKLAAKIPLQDLGDVGNQLLRYYKLIWDVLVANSRAGEKGLSPGSPKAGFDL